MSNLKIKQHISSQLKKGAGYQAVDIGLTLTPGKVVQKKSKKPLNLTFAIDVSGSMGEPMVRSVSYGLGELATNKLQPKMPMSKLDMAKAVMKIALDALNDGDIVSVVAYNSQASVVVMPTLISAQSKQMILAQVGSLRAGGGTDIPVGWMEAMQQCATHLSVDRVNRVINLSDGQTSGGLATLPSTVENVAKMAKAGISTTSVGLGEDFDEVYLTGMAEAGGGNFYYAENEVTMEKSFKDEFNNILNLTHKDVTLQFILPKKDIALISHNDFYRIPSKTNDHITFRLPNMQAKKAYISAYQLQLHDDTSPVEIKYNLTYTLCDGSEQTESGVITIIAEEQPAQDPKFAKEVALIAIAASKKKAAELVRSGNVQDARHMLVGCASALRSFSGQDVVAAEASLAGLNAMLDSASSSVMSKTLLAQSYQTRYSGN